MRKEKKEAEEKKLQEKRNRFEALLDQAIKGGSLMESQKESMTTLFDANPDETLRVLEAMPKRRSVTEQLTDKKNSKTASLADKSWDELDKLGKLAELRANDPTLYQEKYNERGEFVVRDSHAHAFVEVFITGIGWMTFDPTVPGYQRDYSANGTNFDVSTFVSYFSRIVLFIGVAFVLVVFVFLNRIIEVFFRLSLKFRDNGDKVIRLYRRVVRLLTIASNEKLSGYTPEMIREYLVKRRGVELGGLIDFFEKTCFGGYVPDEAEWKMVYAEYKAQWKKLTKREKTTLELDKNM